MQVASRAGVSTATFYEQFEDKEDCLVSAYWTVGERVFRQMRRARRWQTGRTPPLALGPAARRTAGQPDGGRLFARGESRPPVLGCARSGRRRWRCSSAHRQELLDSRAPAAARSIFRRGGGGGGQQHRGLASAQPHRGPSCRRWSTTDRLDGVLRVRREERALEHRPQGAAVDPAPAEVPLALGGPERLPRGRHGLPAGVVARSQRDPHHLWDRRGDDGQGLRERDGGGHRRGRRCLARGLLRILHRQARTRSWRRSAMPHRRCSTPAPRPTSRPRSGPSGCGTALRMLIGLIVSHPTLSYLRLVECYAAGPAAVSRVGGPH